MLLRRGSLPRRPMRRRDLSPVPLCEVSSALLRREEVRLGSGVDLDLHLGLDLDLDLDFNFDEWLWTEDFTKDLVY